MWAAAAAASSLDPLCFGEGGAERGLNTCTPRTRQAGRQTERRKGEEREGEGQKEWGKWRMEMAAAAPWLSGSRAPHAPLSLKWAICHCVGPTWRLPKAGFSQVVLIIVR